MIQRAKGTPKAIKIHNLSLPEFFASYGTEEQCRKHFESIKWPNGFVCPVCGGTHATYYGVKQIYECTSCRHQTSLKAGTIMENSKLSLHQWLLMMYLMACTINGTSAAELHRQVGIGYTAAKLNARKIKVAMSQRNLIYLLKGAVGMDEIFIGSPTKEAKRGLGTEKQQVIVLLSLKNGLFPNYLRLVPVVDATTITTSNVLLENVKIGSSLYGDGKTTYPSLRSHYKVTMEVNNYKEHPDQHQWINTVIFNLKSFLQGTYHGIEKKYLRLALAEFEWRFNRRSLGRHKIDAITRTVVGSRGITHRALVKMFSSVDDQLFRGQLLVPEL